MSKTTILTLDQADAWRAALQRYGAGDVYYEPGYLLPLARRGEGEPLLFVYEDDEALGVHVVLRRPLAALPFAHPYADRFDAISPYGYAGPLIDRDAHAGAMWNAWREQARSLGIVAEFIRFHPLQKNYRPFAEHIETQTLSQTVWIDLTGDIEEQLNKNNRRDQRHSHRDGLRAERVDAQYIPAFGKMYRDTMRKCDADDYYFFADEYFHSLAAGLGEGFQLWRAHVGDVDCGYTLYLRHGPYLHYHLSCSNPAKRHLRSTNYLLVQGSRRAKMEGCRQFHLGGGYRGNDSLFAFKANFSPHRADFVIGRFTHDERVVAELTRLAHEAGQAPAANFFPPYRSGR
ncbi:MAG TPA: GNAT family N-acetyltransferase [bacterium]|nr:GNAT family N-acetyltransferase [bacterium]